MPQEESKSRDGIDTKAAEGLGSKEKASLAATASDPGQTISSTGPAQSNGHRTKVPRWAWKAGAGIIALVVALYFAIPYTIHALNTVSTEDAYVEGHVTFVAPRVVGQVVKVLVDDNNAVQKGDLLVELDKEPYQVKVEQQQAELAQAQADLVAAKARARGIVATARANRWNLQRAIDEVHNQVALLVAKVAELRAKKAVLVRAQRDFDRARNLLAARAGSEQDLDKRQAELAVAEEQVKEALENIYQIRATLGLPEIPKNDEDLAQATPDLDQTSPSVLQAQADLIQSAAQLGVIHSFEQTPEQMLGEFMKSAPNGNLDLLFTQLVDKAPWVKQAEAKLEKAKRDLEQAQLNLSYCDIVAEIDGVITRRNVNPGNNVEIGQSLMAIRSLREIWVEANFKETELSDLRIGQHADLYVDMYGEKRVFKGRISGFTMGTGSTLALLPPQNATGNFVKVVQRLPVRIEIMDYDPAKAPLFVGLSVVVYVNYKEPPTGPLAGKILQPYMAPEPHGNAYDENLEAKP
ncbi:MAG: HlyD family secretion protein [Syntrophobacteraceae bacterium]